MLKEMLEALSVHIFWALFSFVAARGRVFTTAPFGLAVLAGADIKLLPAAAFGAAAGYFMPVSDESPFVYLAAACAICAIRLTLETLHYFKDKPLWNFLVGVGVGTVVWLASARINEATIISAITQGIFVGAGGYFVAVVCSKITSNTSGVSDREFASAAVCINIFLLPLFNVTTAGISIGRILAVIVLLIISRYVSGTYSTVCGAVSALFMALSNTDISVMLYPIGAFLCGVTGKQSKFISTAAFIFSSAFFIILSENNVVAVMRVIECFFACAIFLVIPEKICFKIGSVFARPTDTDIPMGIKGALLMRLKDASSVLVDVSDTVQKVADELARINTPEHSDVLLKIEKTACEGCRLRNSCWDASRDKTVEAIGTMGAAVSACGKAQTLSMPDELRQRCIRREKMESAVYSSYFDFISRLDAESRIKDIRDVICDQFEGISYMLNDLLTEFKTGERYDAKSAIAISDALKEIGLVTEEAAVKLDRNNRMSVELRVRGYGGMRINRMRILNIAESVLKREFEAPVVSSSSKDIMIHIGEKPYYTVVSGIAQINSAGAVVCGDAYNCFEDSKGRFIIMLSDGMGTGGRAAVDSAMASGLISQLVKAGFGFESALKVLNSSMLFKSTDESLATVDISCIDLFTGKTTLLKAGAAPTVVVRSGKVGKAESTSLPAGILRETAFDTADIKIKADDLIIMMSDGAVANGTDWILAEAARFDGDVQKLADRIAKKASEIRDDGYSDDITVIVSSLKKAI